MRPLPGWRSLDKKNPAIAALTNNCTRLQSGSKLSRQKAQVFDCQLEHSIKHQNLTTELGGKVSGAGLFPWGIEEAIVNFQLVEGRARDIVLLI